MTSLEAVRLGLQSLKFTEFFQSLTLKKPFKFNQCSLVDAKSIDEFYDAMVGFINWFYPGTLSKFYLKFIML